jgi:hypothetical protein
MHRAMKCGVITGAIVALSATAWAGGSGRTGTAGALELVIPAKARGAAMGGSVIAASEGTDAWFWNPAGAASLIGTEIAAARRAYIADISLDEVSIAHNAGSFGVIGFTVKALSMDDEPVYTTSQPEGTGEYFASSFVVVGASYARALTDRVDFGINGHYITEKIFRETANGVAFDMGFLYRPSIRGMSFGVVVKNYGPKMKFDGPDFNQDVNVGGENDDHIARTQSASFELPAFIQFGVAWEPITRSQNTWRVTGAFQSNNFSEDEFRIGTEWSMDEQLFLRGGYSGSSQKNYLYGFTAGAGLQVPLGSTVTMLDYTWAEAGAFNSNHFFSLKLRF